MKKFLFLCLIFVLLLIPTLAFADMGAPGFVVYSAYVSNPYGAPYYKTTDLEAEEAGIVPFQTKIICYNDYNERRLAFVLENEDFSYENNYVKYIDKYNVTINDLTKYSLGEKFEARTFANTIIYDLPTDATEGKVLGMIPIETDITVQPYMVNEEETGLWNDWTRWYYTSYNGINGWIKLDDFAFHYDDGNFVTAVNLLTDDGLFVPMLTNVKEYYGFGGIQFARAIFYYEGERVGYDEEIDVASKLEPDRIADHTYEVLFDGIALYEQANVKSKKIVESVPVGTTLVGEYVVWGHAFETWLGVRYEGSIRWMYIGEMHSYKNKSEAEKQFELNRQTLDNAKANNWDWYDDLNYPTDLVGLKRYYDYLINDGFTYSDKAIEESDATMKVEDIKKIASSKNDSNEMTKLPGEGVSLKVEESQLRTNEMIVAIVAILAFVVVVVATLITVIVLVVKKKK